MKIFALTAVVTLAIILTSCSIIDNISDRTSNIKKDTTKISGERNGASVQYRIITAEEGKKMLNSQNNITLLDVRTVEENEEVRIPGSLLIPLDELELKAPELLPDKASVLVIYCRSGRRSALAAEKMIELGYTNVFDMGGILDWPYETESSRTEK